MFSQFFGSYLVKRKLISMEQLRQVLALQDAVRVKIGVLAIDAGYMTAIQVGAVHARQVQVDKRFGELAIEYGYLNEEKLTELLGRQNKRHLLISQALVDGGVLSLEQVEEAFQAYKKESGFSDAEFEALKNNDMDAVTAALVRMPEMGGKGEYAEYFGLFVRNLVRFIDSGITLERAEKVTEFPVEFMVHQEMDGRFKLFTGIAGSEAGLAEFAARFAKAEIQAMGELGIDAMSEFMNVQNGLWLSRLSNDWVELELAPSEFVTDTVLRSVGVVYRVPFTLPFGEFSFFIGLGSPVLTATTA
jgi:hypothetical protein